MGRPCRNSVDITPFFCPASRRPVPRAAWTTLAGRMAHEHRNPSTRLRLAIDARVAVERADVDREATSGTRDNRRQAKAYYHDRLIVNRSCHNFT
jgi:hypothetical protein